MLLNLYKTSKLCFIEKSDYVYITEHIRKLNTMLAQHATTLVKYSTSHITKAILNSNKQIYDKNPKNVEKTLKALYSHCETNRTHITNTDNEIEQQLKILQDLYNKKTHYEIQQTISKKQLSYLQGGRFNNVPDHIIAYMLSNYTDDHCSRNLSLPFLNSNYWLDDIHSSDWNGLSTELQDLGYSVCLDIDESDRILTLMSLTCKKFNTCVKTQFVCSRIQGKYDNSVIKNSYIEIPLGVNKKEFTEQLLYTPLGSSGRTILHQLTRVSNFCQVEKFIQMFPRLNTTVGTVKHNWTIAHNSLLSCLSIDNVQFMDNNNDVKLLHLILSGLSVDEITTCAMRYHADVDINMGLFEFIHNLKPVQQDRLQAIDNIICKHIRKNKDKAFEKTTINYDIISNLKLTSYLRLERIFDRLKSNRKTLDFC